MAGGRSMSRREATRVAIFSQAIAVLLVAATVAAFMLWPSSRTGTAKAVETSAWAQAQSRAGDRRAAERAKDAVTEQDAAAPTDPATLAELLEQVGHIKRAEAVAESDAASEDDPGKEDVATTEAPPLGGGLASFLGVVEAGEQRWGLFRLGASQGLIRVGGERGFRPHGEPGETPVALKVLSVEPDHAMVIEGGVERRLEKAVRTGGAFSVAAAQTGVPTEPKPEKQLDKSANRSATLPRVEDFRQADGTINREEFAKAMRNAQSLRAGEAGSAGAEGAGTEQRGATSRRRLNIPGGGAGGGDRTAPPNGVREN